MNSPPTCHSDPAERERNLLVHALHPQKQIPCRFAPRNDGLTFDGAQRSICCFLSKTNKSRSLALLPSTPLPSTLLRDAEQSRGVRDGEQSRTVGMTRSRRFTCGLLGSISTLDVSLLLERTSVVLTHLVTCHQLSFFTVDVYRFRNSTSVTKITEGRDIARNSRGRFSTGLAILSAIALDPIPWGWVGSNTADEQHSRYARWSRFKHRITEHSPSKVVFKEGVRNCQN